MYRTKRIVKATGEKDQVTYKGWRIRIAPDFSMQTLKARRVWMDVLQALRDHGWQLTLTYPAKLSATTEERKKNALINFKFKQFLPVQLCRKH